MSEPIKTESSSKFATQWNRAQETTQRQRIRRASGMVVRETTQGTIVRPARRPRGGSGGVDNLRWI